jgi:hypothetical protein
MQTSQGILSHGVFSFGSQAAAATRAFSKKREIFAFCRLERSRTLCHGPSVPLIGELSRALSSIRVAVEGQGCSNLELILGLRTASLIASILHRQLGKSTSNIHS